MREVLERLVGQLGPGPFKGSMRIFLDHGLLFVEDRDSSARYDEFSSGRQIDVVRVRKDSLCIATQLYVDGAVSVFVLSEAESPELGTRVFDGEIDVPSGWLRIEDSDEAGRMVVRVNPGVVGMSIRVDNNRFPECVLVSLR